MQAKIYFACKWHFGVVFDNCDFVRFLRTIVISIVYILLYIFLFTFFGLPFQSIPFASGKQKKTSETTIDWKIFWMEKKTWQKHIHRTAPKSDPSRFYWIKIQLQKTTF